jgi:hypothetical protein
MDPSDGDLDAIRLGRDLSAAELLVMADKLPWVIPNVFIMPPHQYVVDKYLKTEEERQAFAALCDSCSHHPDRWKAFFRAYKAKNSYMDIGEYRYWYSQVGAARMMNRSYRESDVENIRGEIGDRAVKNWSGCTYAWRREYGLACENLHRYCNLIIVEVNPSGSNLSIISYAAMVTRNAVSSWHAGRRNHDVDGNIEENIRSHFHGIESIAGIKPANSVNVSCSDEEIGLKAIWMKHKDMSPPKVATDLRWFSTAPRLEIEMVAPLKAERNYLIQLSVPPV